MSEIEQTKIIEINGVRFEVDARTATMRQVQNVQIGARVKVLIKKYSDSFEVNHGVVIGFEPFGQLPTVIIAYVPQSYSSNTPEIKFLYYNASSKEEVVISDENDREAFVAKNVVERLDKQIEIKEREIDDLRERQRYFKENFSTYWQSMAAPTKEDEF